MTNGMQGLRSSHVGFLALVSVAVCACSDAGPVKTQDHGLQSPPASSGAGAGATAFGPPAVATPSPAAPDNAMAPAMPGDAAPGGPPGPPDPPGPPAMPGQIMPPGMPTQPPDPQPSGPVPPVSTDPKAPAGPMEGDPSKPMVAVDGVPCGVPNAGFGGAPATVTIGGREVVVAYPCAHEDAPVTFFLFLHGTLQEAQKVPFTMNAFPIHRFVDSHNVIVVVPKAVGTQWGNGDNGADLPHLYEVVDWVYDTFGQKFDIRSMWASGGSWGAFYLNRTFACDAKFEGRLRGVRMVVGSGCPACSDRLACIVAEQELEEGGGMPLSPDQQEMKSSSNIDRFATPHGCDPKTKMPDLGPVRHWTWPNCTPGFVHSYYLGPGQHADPWNDPTSLEYMVNEIKSIE